MRAGAGPPPGVQARRPWPILARSAAKNRANGRRRERSRGYLRPHVRWASQPRSTEHHASAGMPGRIWVK
jgi:hypothetical protein